MKSIEKILTNYLNGKGPIITKEELSFYAESDANDTINTFFKVINEEVEKINGVGTADRIINLMDCISKILHTAQNVNRKIVSRKLNKLYEKAERIKSENKKQFVNSKIAIRELDRIQKNVELLQEIAAKKDSEQYNLISLLIDTFKSITYIEYTFKNMPSLVNVTDREEVSLFRNIVKKYIDSIINIEQDEESYYKSLYYNNLISLILNQRAFNLSEKEKRAVLDLLNMSVDKLSIDKKKAKKNREKIEQLIKIINAVKGLEDDKPKRVDLIADKYHISVFFDEDLIEKAKLARTPKEGEMTDREVIDDYIITIDGENAQEIDDALSCKILPNGNYLLGVHIASILGYFPYESDIVQEAISRNKSIYLSKMYQKKDDDFCKTIPIFPYEFSAKIASLIPGERKLTRTYYFEIDKNGNVVNERFVKSIIKSSKKTTYNEINNIIENGCEDKKLEELVRNLQAVATILDKKYVPTELYEQVKECTDDYSDLRVKRVGAEKIVYQAMLLTGNRVAEFFASSERNYPCLYRVHKVNEENAKKLSAMINSIIKTYGEEQFSKLHQLIEGLYPRGWYDTSGAHSGLGLEHYCHCTSGLRRAADIIVEHAMEICYDRTPTDEEIEALREEIEKKVSEINSKDSPIEWFVKDFNRAYQKRR